MVEFAIAHQSLDPNNVFIINHDDQEKNLKRLREINHVLATENEGLREEVKQWVQQAIASQRQLEEAKRHLKRELELERVSKIAVDFQSALDE
ncbi:glial fibrillary acidic protein-like [Cucumis melo var. makuwa]|nr:glial fibrillary acidic protein-like [Cucumis melo var. makuwa]TYK03344.1 glial fibrillary acidic protein-like [Cucumis melo var. makuwa]